MMLLPYIVFILLLTPEARGLNWQKNIINDFLHLYNHNETNQWVGVKTIDDPSVVATVKSYKSHHDILLYSGLAKSARLTVGAFAMTLCHEVGHVFAGPPFFQRPKRKEHITQFSSEGQADYYAAMVCYKKLLSRSPTLRKKQVYKEHPRLRKLCELAHASDPNDTRACELTAQAGYELLTLVYDFPISFENTAEETPDHVIKNIYPSRQCRLDTYLAGALCSESLPLDLRKTKQNFCLDYEARRPTCWFPRSPYFSNNMTQRHFNWPGDFS